MGLVIGITACCCAYCAIKKKRKQNRRRLAEGQAASEENGLDDDADESMMREQGDDATDDELNADSPLQADGIEIGMNSDRPPPYQAVSVPMETVLEEIDEADDMNIGGSKHSSNKVKYNHLSDTAEVVETSKGVAPETSTSDGKENSHARTEEDAFIKEVIDKMSEIEEEGAFGEGSKKQSSKKYKYSPLKGPTSSERKRVKSGDSQKDHEEIKTSWSNDMYIDEPATDV
ncbi:uncharacterized protein LOC100893181 [Strongylocentrotus purpuratus]|uniref:Uncharacterized protein n=1 Tax=Strongylocentrotus purpuratus TaxID=7668 RepID=A0A7M7GF81_STRPU|nr:uncharacterized protein LOC100893181 [Strongylocentrotus purpuratus]